MKPPSAPLAPLRVDGSRWGAGSRLQGTEQEHQSPSSSAGFIGFKVQGSGFRVQGLGFRVRV